MTSTVALDSLTINDINPRSIAESALRTLCESIKRDPQFMVLRPIIVDEQGVVLGGNQRLRACRELGMTHVPSQWVQTASGLTDEQRRRFIIIDNAPEGMSGFWDPSLLSSFFDAAELVELGLQKYLADVSVPSDNQSIDESLPDTAQHECPNCGHRW